MNMITFLLCDMHNLNGAFLSATFFLDSLSLSLAVAPQRSIFPFPITIVAQTRSQDTSF